MKVKNGYDLHIHKKMYRKNVLGIPKYLLKHILEIRKYLVYLYFMF